MPAIRCVAFGVATLLASLCSLRKRRLVTSVCGAKRLSAASHRLHKQG